MKLKKFTLAEIAKAVDLEFQGNPNHCISSVATLQDANPEQLSFLANPKYRKHLTNSKAGIVILTPEEVKHCPTNSLISKTPRLAYAKVAKLFEYEPTLNSGIHSSTIIGQHCNIDPNVTIGAHCVIGDYVTIGANTVIEAGCVINEYCQIGENCHFHNHVTFYHHVVAGHDCIFHSGCVIGSDGFGFEKNGEQWEKVPQLGSVRLGNFVDVGANTTIDRGAIRDTIIEDGVKLDNQIQVGHNVSIGAHTVIAGCVGISGSSKIGKHCLIGGFAGIAGHLEIADNVVLTARSFVTKSVDKPGVYSSGTVLQTNQEWRKSNARYRQLDKLAKLVHALKKKLSEL